MTREQLYEYIMSEQDKNMQKHPELAMNKMAAISGMIAQAKIEGAREVIEEIVQAFRKHGVTYMLNKLDELEERYEVGTK